MAGNIFARFPALSPRKDQFRAAILPGSSCRSDPDVRTHDPLVPSNQQARELPSASISPPDSPCPTAKRRDDVVSDVRVDHARVGERATHYARSSDLLEVCCCSSSAPDVYFPTDAA